MLTHIHIENFTIIDSLSLDFDHGLSVLTGETGAGKSIWIDAVSYALGARADSSVIRHGESRCVITLCFDTSQHRNAQQWLIDHDYEEDNECIIRRVIASNGPSRASINGKPCPLQSLRDLGGLLLNIHGQHDNQILLKRSAQQQRLDDYANHHQQLSAIEKVHSAWKKTNEALNHLRSQVDNRDAELSLLQYQSKELESLQLKPNEWDKLSHQHQQLHNAKELITQLNQAIELTIENEATSATQILQQAIRQLDEIRFDVASIKSAKALLSTAAIHLQEAGDELQEYRHGLDLSPDNLANIEQRLSSIHDLARKHHVNPQDLLDIQQSIADKLKKLENVDSQLEALEQAKVQYERQYQTIATKLTASRRKAAKSLEKIITKSIQSLSIDGGLFRVQLEKREASIHPEGQEKVIFEVSTNPGQPFQAMSKIVSGGELSRISLALQVVTTKKEHTPTMIFDEVDTGIGGKTAETVGQLLRQLGNSAQVLCITHLPQVAAQGHHHYKISKSSQKKSTHTTIEKLNETARINELARMLSGAKITQQTLAHASQLLAEKVTE
jgi:DNA repair protein RecN (Recombination protein N)